MHTLDKHVGKTDAQLAQRLRDQGSAPTAAWPNGKPSIGAASTFATDPRGWLALDWDAEHELRRQNASYPFTRQSLGRLAQETYELSRESAAEQLVLMMDDWFAVPSAAWAGRRCPDLLSDAQTVLSRYSDHAAFYTTAVDARTTATPDFSKRATAGLAFTDYIYDLGLIVVGPEEVGVAWRFNAE